MKKIIGILLGFLLVVVVGIGTGWATMACSNPSSGTVTSSSDKAIGTTPAGVRLLQISYTTASSGGTFTCITNSYVNGWILYIETDPGSTAPTTLYDIDLDNDNGRDVMGGALDDRSATVTEGTRPLDNGNYQVIENYGFLTVQVTAAGNSKTAEILIFYLPF